MFGFPMPDFIKPLMSPELDNINIEVQDLSGNWRLHSVTRNNPLYILNEMQTAQAFHNGARVRAINSVGTIVNIM